MAAIRTAVRTQMRRKNHAQQAVSSLTGVTQSQISRVLSGQRKRVTPAVILLCQYAEFEIERLPAALAAERQLSQVLRGAIGDNVAAAAVVARVLEALAPVLRAYHPDDAPRPAVRRIP